MPSSSVDLPEGVTELRIPEQKVFDGQPFPLILTPSPSHLSESSSYWPQWSLDNIDSLKRLLVQYGAIMFRGFPIKDPEIFDRFAKSYGWKEFPYVGGVSVREPVVGNVYTSTESPPECKIPFHHEMAHVDNHPKVLFFYCDVAAPEGGETPLALSHVIHDLMSQREPDFVQRLTKEGLRYVRVAPENNDNTSALGRGWKSTFFAETKEEAETKAKEKGFDIEWLPDNNAKTITKVLKAIRVNEQTGRSTWFNSTLTCYTAWQDARNVRTKAVLFPNGDEMPESAMNTLQQVIEEVEVAIRWQQGDIILIDNLQAQHARRHFTPPRRILASLYTY